MAVAGLASALGADEDKSKIPTSAAPVHHTEKLLSQTTIFTLNGTKYLVPNPGDTPNSYQERLKTDAQKLDKKNQEWAKKNRRVPNTTPVRSVADLYKKDSGAYIDLAVAQICFSKCCSEEEALQSLLQDKNNPWVTFAKQVQKEKNIQNAVTHTQTAQGR